MYRRTWSVALLAVVLCPRCSLADPTGSVTSTKRPNIVLILIDDLNHYGVTAYGANRIRSLRDRFPDQEFSTPSIDRLAREG